MTHIYLLNGAKAFAHSAGKLNHTLQDLAATHLQDAGFSVRQKVIDEGYDLDEEVHSFMAADIILYQFPGWWMGSPWIVKKYMDEVFTHAHGTFYENDGRTRTDPSKLYGSGGLLIKKRVMASTTWNAPADAFAEKHQFFEGGGIDALLFPFYKAHAFLGMTHLPSFIATDVMKQPNIEAITQAYRQHLNRYIIQP